MGVIATEYVVECDDCLESVGHYLHWESEREAKDAALNLGWETWRGSSWICPDCQAIGEASDFRLQAKEEDSDE